VIKRLGHTKNPPYRPIAWLTIRCFGGRLHDWRDMQEIKNLLCGTECEAVEIYPAESELIDANNNFHLWVFLDGYKCPFGFRGLRALASPSKNPDYFVLETPQREFASIPPDATDSLESSRKIVKGQRPFLTVADYRQWGAGQKRK